jgi:hypothetical protein
MDLWTLSYSPAFRPPIESVMAFADWLLPLLLITLDDEHGRDPFETPHDTRVLAAPVMDPAALS